MTDMAIQSTPNPAQLMRMVTSNREGVTAMTGLITIAAFIIFGWYIREQTYLTAESGLGYALGIIGSVFMLLLLLYPARKHARWARHLGRVKYWFRAHMILGIAGPLCILYHCNFQLGSTNSNITLFVMLTVAISGIFGRYFYTRIHYGLYGRKAALSELSSTQAFTTSRLSEVISLAPQLRNRIDKISATSNGWAPDFLIGGFLMHWRYWSIQPTLERAYRITADRKQWDKKTYRHNLQTARSHLHDFLAASRKIHEFAIYQRLFSLWHVLHVPLFVMLVLSATVHVFAVHMY